VRLLKRRRSLIRDSYKQFETVCQSIHSSVHAVSLFSLIVTCTRPPCSVTNEMPSTNDGIMIFDLVVASGSLSGQTKVLVVHEFVGARVTRSKDGKADDDTYELLVSQTYKMPLSRITYPEESTRVAFA
jgi:hypothetical protein